MRRIQTVLIAAACVLAAGSGWCAGDKYAVIDFERAMKEYHKTKPAEAEIERQKAEYKAEIEKMAGKLEALNQAFETAREETRNRALNEEALKDKLDAAEKKQMEVREYEMEMRKFADTEKKRMMENALRMRKQFSDDIIAVVRKYATDKGITLVVDSSTAIQELRAAVIYRDDGIDITSTVIKTLNGDKAGADSKK